MIFLARVAVMYNILSLYIFWILKPTQCCQFICSSVDYIVTNMHATGFYA